MTANLTDYKSTTNTINASNPLTSLEEFNKKFEVKVENRIITVIERTNNIVQAHFDTIKEKEQYRPFWNPTHFYQGTYYFVLSSEKYTKAQYVYSYDYQNKEIKWIVSSLRNPTFIENLLVNFGEGFTTTGDAEIDGFMPLGKGIITVYDLSRPKGERKVRTITVEGGSGSGWDGSIDSEKKLICAWDHVTGKRQNYPLFDKA